MKRRRKIEAVRSTTSTRVTSTDTNLHFRLCHVCFHLNESEAAIPYCTKCGRLLSVESIPPEQWKAIEASMRAGEQDDWGGEGRRPIVREAEDDDDFEFGDEMPNLNGLSVLF